MNLNEMALKVSPKVLQNDLNFKGDSETVVGYLHSISEEEKMQIQRKTLTDRFEGNKVQNIGKGAINSKRKRDAPTHMITLELFQIIDLLDFEESSTFLWMINFQSMIFLD